MATGTLKRLGGPALVPNTAVTIYTVPAATKCTSILIRLANTDTQDNLIALWIVPSGGSASNSNAAYLASKPNGLWIPPSGTAEVDLVDILEAGEFIQLQSNVNNKVCYRISGQEIT